MVSQAIDDTRWTAVRITKIAQAQDRQGQPQWELSVRWEWTPAANTWGERVWVYKETAPADLAEGTYNVLVRRGNLKKKQDGTVHDGSQDWMHQFQILEWEAMGAVPRPPTAAPQQPTPLPNNVQYAPVDSVEVIAENQMRIMRQSTLNYAATLVSSLKDWNDSSLHPEAIERLMVEKTISVSQKLLEYVISGEMPSFETPDDSQDDSQDLLDHEV